MQILPAGNRASDESKKKIGNGLLGTSTIFVSDVELRMRNSNFQQAQQKHHKNAIFRNLLF